MMRIVGVYVLGLALLSAAGTLCVRSAEVEDAAVVHIADLPREAQETLARIKQGGPYPYARDGTVFANRERHLPAAARGSYREYTVPTPGRHDRGARRIIATRSDRFWYSEDHYRSFRQIIE
ncbi:MAG: ribonuclease domain-containing protein [Betaproteobacteria bacterium]